jgi:hypothetical protein
VAGKISWYQQLDFQSLAMEFSGGKLKQKGFFHSVHFLHYKIIGAPKKFKNQPRPLVRLSSLNFSQNF